MTEKQENDLKEYLNKNLSLNYANGKFQLVLAGNVISEQEFFFIQYNPSKLPAPHPDKMPMPWDFPPLKIT